jgi:hypothetical protein
MISVVSVYDDVRFRVNKENGFLSVKEFNDASWLAQLSLIDWATGSFSGQESPKLYESQKGRDLISFLITKYSADVVNGEIDKPSDYYLFEDLYKVNGIITELIDGEEITHYVPNVTIDLLTSNKFNQRANTSIEELKPSSSSVICKMHGSKIEIVPSDVGAVTLEYIRYPLKSSLAITIDPVYNDEVPDLANSNNFEWGAQALKPLVWFIVDEIANHTREQALKQFNAASEGGKR